ncbi:MAG: cytochrome P450 [Actinomycetota bacterium]|nr:cytochrome P450 [Actinomycetota bacterium]
MRRSPALVLAATAVGLAVVLSLLSVDVLHQEHALASGDVEFAARRGGNDAWRTREIVPGGVARSLLGVNDDLHYRKAMRLFRLARPRALTLGDPGLPPLRAEAEQVLGELAAAGDDPVEKSRVLNLLGVLALARAVDELAQTPDVFRKSISIFRSAIDADPGNEDAKANLELVLRVRASRARNQPPTAKRRRAGSKRAGLSGAGGGY